MSSVYSVAGAQLGYSDSGTGLPIVFLHPTPLDRAFWSPLTQELSGIRSIVPDLRGHGASELGHGLPIGLFSRVPDAPALTMAQLAGDIIALLDHLQIPAAVFAGCSIGGYVLLELWRRIPERMQGLAFLCSKPQPDAESNLVKRAENIARVRSEGTSGFFDSNAQSLVSANTRAQHPDLVAKLRSQMTLALDAVVAVQTGLAVRPDSVPTVATIHVPVLAIAGQEDAAVTPADMEAFRSAPGGCDYHVIPNAGHFAAYEHPRAVAALMAPWLQQFQV